MDNSSFSCYLETLTPAVRCQLLPIYLIQHNTSNFQFSMHISNLFSAVIVSIWFPCRERTNKNGKLICIHSFEFIFITTNSYCYCFLVRIKVLKPKRCVYVFSDQMKVSESHFHYLQNHTLPFRGMFTCHLAQRSYFRSRQCLHWGLGF